MAVPTSVAVPIAPPIAVPTPVTPSQQRTIPQYFAKKGVRDGPREVERTPPEKFHWPKEYDFTITDTPPSEFATPGENSPETVGKGSVDEADTEPSWPRGATSDMLTRIDTYKFVRVVDLEKLDLNERKRYERRVEQTTMECTVRDEGSSDTQGPSEQPRDVTLPKEVTFDWRVDLRAFGTTA